MTRWLPAVLIALTFLLSAWLLPRLPASVELEVGVLLPFDVDGESGPRAWLAFGLPTVALALWAIFLALRSGRGLAIQKRVFADWAPSELMEPGAVARFRSTYDLVVVLVIAFLLAFHTTMVAIAAGAPPATARAFLVLVGLGLAVMGNVIPRLRPNPIMGVRTKTTLRNPVLWARIHRLFGALLFASGVLVVLLAVFAVRYALIGFIAALLLSCLIVLIVVRSSERGTRVPEYSNP